MNKSSIKKLVKKSQEVLKNRNEDLLILSIHLVQPDEDHNIQVLATYHTHVSMSGKKKTPPNYGEYQGERMEMDSIDFWKLAGLDIQAEDDLDDELSTDERELEDLPIVEDLRSVPRNP